MLSFIGNNTTINTPLWKFPRKQSGIVIRNVGIEAMSHIYCLFFCAFTMLIANSISSGEISSEFAKKDIAIFRSIFVQEFCSEIQRTSFFADSTIWSNSCLEIGIASAILRYCSRFQVVFRPVKKFETFACEVSNFSAS